MNRMLSESISTRVDALLHGAILQASAQAVYLTDRGGYIIGNHVTRDLPMEDNFVALIAGAFYASQQAAQLLGDTEFKSMLERGKQASVLVEGLEGDHLLIMVFGGETNVGLVKLAAKSLVQQLNPIVQDMKDDKNRPVGIFEMDTSRPVFELARPAPG